MWADDLTALGYLSNGESPARALMRFQRHALRVYRKTVEGQSIAEPPVYSGPVDGIAHQPALDEISRWILRGFRLPLGYYGLSKIAQFGSLRSDVAAAWTSLMANIKQIGGTIDGPYGDTKRPLMNVISPGASKYSFHICGRAIDLNQGLGNSRYFVSADPQGARMFWRIFCKTADQTGAQGRHFAAGTFECHSFATHAGSPNPPAYYIDMTAEIERGGQFERIASQNGWQEDARMSEWWHFQWVPDKQKTFQDECELIGVSGQQLRAYGYNDADLDHLPG
jgi:hypothetical protein